VSSFRTKIARVPAMGHCCSDTQQRQTNFATEEVAESLKAVLAENVYFCARISLVHATVGDGAEKRDPLLRRCLRPLCSQHMFNKAEHMLSKGGDMEQRNNM
jgi:hypothetical protein